MISASNKRNTLTFEVENGFIYVDSIEENLAPDFLSSDELLKFKSFKFEKRKNEWLNTRLLLREKAGNNCILRYAENGKPSLQKSDSGLNELSISHCKGFVALALGSKPIGIDIEIVRESVNRILHKFVNENEKKWIDNSLKHATVIWTCKEAIFKIWGEKLPFKDIILKESLEKNKLYFSVPNKTHKAVLCTIHFINQQTILAIAQIVE